MSPDLFEPPLVWRDQTGVTLMNGLAWAATALARYVGEYRVESPLHTLAEAVQILATIDDARRQLGESDSRRRGPVVAGPVAPDGGSGRG